MLALYLRLRNWLAEKEEGQDLIEYALLIVLIAVVVIVALSYLGPVVANVFNKIGGNLAPAAS